MSKNLKLSFLLTFLLCAICLAWQTIKTFFSGVGLAFVAVLAIVLAMMVIVILDKETRKRIMDLFCVSVAFVALESIIYFALEFGEPSQSLIRSMHIYQNVINMFAFLFLAYAIFRLICELKGSKIAFIEMMLGNQKNEKKARQSKELSNGSLEEKPKKSEVEVLDDEVENNSIEQTIELEDSESSETEE